MEETVPNVEIKPYSSVFRDEVRHVVMKLKKYYPSIEVWLDKELPRLDAGMDACWLIVDQKGDVLGAAITGLETEGVGKLKTFYLSEEVRKCALGVRLLKDVLNYWISKGIRNVFVTFAEEELDELKGFFDKFGFVMDGLKPGFYRPGKTEYIMSKTFIYDQIGEEEFEGFIRNQLLQNRGITPQGGGSEFVAFEDNRISKTPQKVYVMIVKEKEPDGNGLFHHIEQKLAETESAYGIIASFYPLREPSGNGRIKVHDGYILENMFFPLRLKRPGSSGIILPIEKYYAEGLLQLEEPARGIPSKRLALTHEKVYYTGKDSFGGVSRGGIFLFHLMGGHYLGGIVGEAKIKVLDTLTVEEAIRKYVMKGVIRNEDELRMHSNRGRVSIFLLTHVKTYPKRVPIDAVRNVVPGVNFQCYPVTDSQIDEIRRLSGNDSRLY